MPIDGRKKHGSIVSELIREFKESGKIGNSEPEDMDAAMKQANAIAYDVKGTAKVEALETYITSLVRSDNKTFIEGVVMSGFNTCFEGHNKLEDCAVMEADDLESDDIVRMDTDSMTSDEVDVVQTQLDDIKQDKQEMETKQEEISSKEEELVNTSAALSLNEAKSKAASAVLQLMDKQEDPNYQKALKQVLSDNPELNKAELEKELNTYI